MIESLKDRMEDVYSVVLVANTPAYLYDNLREVLSGMAKRVRLPALIAELRNEVAAAPSEEYHQSSYIYALFILMTYDRYEDVRHHLDWIGSIKTNVVSMTTVSYTFAGTEQSETKVVVEIL